MRIWLFSQVVMGLVLTLSTTTTFYEPSYAQTTTFYCGKSKGIPATMARTQDGKKVPVIRWVSNNYFPPPWTERRRCFEVSRRFQKNFDNGSLKNITTGMLRGQPVVCAAISKNNPCTDTTLLFTLKRGVDANATVRRLLDRRGVAAGYILSESGSDKFNIDFDVYLNNATVEPNSDSFSQTGK